MIKRLVEMLIFNKMATFQESRFLLKNLLFRTAQIMEIISRNLIPYINDTYISEGRVKFEVNCSSHFGEIFLTEFENGVSRKTHLKFCEPITLS